MSWKELREVLLLLLPAACHPGTCLSLRFGHLAPQVCCVHLRTRQAVTCRR